MQAGVNPEDLLPRSIDYFKHKQSVEEVAKIRYQHHVQKRLSKSIVYFIFLYIYFDRKTIKNWLNNGKNVNETAYGCNGIRPKDIKF